MWVFLFVQDWKNVGIFVGLGPGKCGYFCWFRTGKMWVFLLVQDWKNVGILVGLGLEKCGYFVCSELGECLYCSI